MKKRKVYILYGSGQKNLQLLDNTKEYLKEMGKEKNFDFDFICRETLQKAEEKFEEDMKTSFDMAFFNLSLNKDDIEMFEEIKEMIMPPYREDYFSSLGFIRKFKEKQKICRIIFFTPFEKRSLITFFLTHSADWTISLNKFTKSLIAMLIELFFKGDRCSRCGQELFGTINLPDGTKVCFNCFELASAKGENVCWNVDRANPEDPGTGKVISHIVQMIKAKK